jgi:hypothetical protein
VATRTSFPTFKSRLRSQGVTILVISGIKETLRPRDPVRIAAQSEFHVCCKWVPPDRNRRTKKAEETRDIGFDEAMIHGRQAI